MTRDTANDITDWRALSPERFGFLVFLAAAVHGILLLALSFDWPEPTPRAPTLDITLAQFQQKEAPKEHRSQAAVPREERWQIITQ